MKKSLQLMAVIAMSFAIVSCSDVSSLDNTDTALNSLNKSARVTGQDRGCASMDVLEENMKEDHSLKDKMDDIENIPKILKRK